MAPKDKAVSASANEETGSNKGAEDDVVPSGEEAEQEDEEEDYEIEAILEAKKGQFPRGRTGFLVKWKGYDSSHNSWVDEKDANAPELIEAFWATQKTSKGRKSTDKKTLSKGLNNEEESASSAPKKRGRKSTTNDEDESAVDRKTKAQKRRKSQSATDHEEILTVEDDGQPVIDMREYMNQKTWENLVDTVDTVEQDGKKLSVYFKLKSGERVKESSELCNTRFPQKMLKFYEGNLRWREAEVEDVPANSE
ncbi:hypothetical protein C8J56DRAFT_872338 [Mycena floridula]|nr:hypothetical protein C8J56DRAFT_872338 [Mycena floridula]